MKEFPFYKQVNNKDCGMTCLRMIAKYYGKSSDILTISSLTKAHPKSMSLLQLKSNAESLGLKTSASRVPVNYLGKIDLPVILHWNRNHFVILFEVDKNSYHIADPARGVLILTQQELIPHWKDEEYTTKNGGIVLGFSDLKL